MLDEEWYETRQKIVMNQKECTQPEKPPRQVLSAAVH
jgi:hypothetical protein